MKKHPTFSFTKTCFSVVFCCFWLLSLPACNDGREVNLTIPTEVYLVQAGLQTVGFPESGEPQAVLTVYKGGYNDDGVTVRLGISEYALDRYNEENATGYRTLLHIRHPERGTRRQALESGRHRHIQGFGTARGTSLGQRMGPARRRHRHFVGRSERW